MCGLGAGGERFFDGGHAAELKGMKVAPVTSTSDLKWEPVSQWTSWPR